MLPKSSGLFSTKALKVVTQSGHSDSALIARRGMPSYYSLPYVVVSKSDKNPTNDNLSIIWIRLCNCFPFLIFSISTTPLIPSPALQSKEHTHNLSVQSAVVISAATNFSNACWSSTWVSLDITDYLWPYCHVSHHAVHNQFFSFFVILSFWILKVFPRVPLRI
jgi:hypothetical protein